MLKALILTLIFALPSVLPTLASASAGVTYQGRILKPDGTALTGKTVQFILQIRSPDAASCLLYEETQTLDLSKTDGAFSLTMNNGSGTRTDSSGYSFQKIFANQGSFTLVAPACATGTTYSPSVDDGRALAVQFKDESMASWEPVPIQMINSVPFAMQAKEVTGFPVTSLVRVAESDGTLNPVSPLSNSAYTELLALVNGTSAQFAKLNGTTMPTMTAGQVLGWNGTSWTSVDASSTHSETLLAPSPSTNKITFNAPSLSADYTITWPPNAGAAGQVLTSNGSGVLTWSTNVGAPTLLLKTANYTVTAADIANKTTILADTSGGSFTVTLPDPSTVSTNVLTIVDKTGSFSVNALNLAPHGSEKIQGLNASVLLSAANGSYALQSDGTNWYKVSSARNSARASYTSGTSSWTAPAGVTSVTVYGRGGSAGGGGGGGGGGGSATAGARGGGAGAGGGSTMTVSRTVTVVPGATYVITVGAGGTGGTGGNGASASSTGAAGTAGTTGTAGGSSTFGSLVKIQGAQLNYQSNNSGGAGSLGAAGSGGNVGRGILSLNCSSSGSGGTAGNTGTGGSALGSLSPFGDGPSVTGASTSGGTGGGGGGGGSGPCPAGDGAGVSGVSGGAGGTSGSPGVNGTNGHDGLDGAAGVGGGGGGGGGLLAGTGTAGGNGGNGGNGSSGYITLQWNE